VRLLIDNALSPEVARGLQGAGYDAVHVRELGAQEAADADLFELAASEGFVIVSTDTDFGTILALRHAASPSVVLLRHGAPRRPPAQVALLAQVLPRLAEELVRGCIVVIDERRIRVRLLPIGRTR
jgi:predicted nuclease of predicted toxin-antitoxin system